MKHLIEETPMTRFVIEPGDATQYTVLLGWRKDEVYVCIGAGENVRCGYFLPEHLLADLGTKLRSCCEEGMELREAIVSSSTVSYWISHRPTV